MEEPVRLTVGLETDNAAFEDPSEISRILGVIGGRVQQALQGEGDSGGKVRDINGNTVGHWSVEEE